MCTAACGLPVGLFLTGAGGTQTGPADLVPHWATEVSTHCVSPAAASRSGSPARLLLLVYGAGLATTAAEPDDQALLPSTPEALLRHGRLVTGDQTLYSWCRGGQDGTMCPLPRQLGECLGDDRPSATARIVDRRMTLCAPIKTVWLLSGVDRSTLVGPITLGAGF